MNILVVDDSAVFRMGISKALEEISFVKEVNVARDGGKCLEFLERKKDVNLIIMDLEMPVLDGISTIKKIRETNKKTYIIVFSSLSISGAQKTMDALAAGADDFVTKTELSSSNFNEEGTSAIRKLLEPKVESFYHKDSSFREKSIETSRVEHIRSEDFSSILRVKPTLISIASSTGGPDALMKIFKEVKSPPGLPLVLVQHMPPLFTERLAVMLSNVCPHIKFVEAKEGHVLENNVCYVAPGDYHMKLFENRISLNQDEKVCFVRPAADVLMKSIANNYNKRVLHFTLTGMGEDSCAGAKLMKEKNHYVFIQSESTCVVWGMPGAIHAAKAFDLVVPVSDFSEIINFVGSTK